MTNRVIDADGHICEPPAVWNDYVEKRHRADTIRVERDADGRDWVSINGALRRNLRPAAACVPWGMDDPNKVPRETSCPAPTTAAHGCWKKASNARCSSRRLPAGRRREDPAVAAATCHS